MSRMKERDAALGERWLLFVHQLPARPSYIRVKLWRRLHAIGAVAVKNGVHALPLLPDALEDFEWLLREVGASGGGAAIVEARLVSGINDADLCALFNAARAQDYLTIAGQAAKLAQSGEAGDGKLGRLRARFERARSIDFFHARERTVAENALRLAERRRAEASSGDRAEAPEEFHGRTWVTRAGVFVDRIASAWLIARFIDPDPSFKFTPVRNYSAQPGELRFDMFEAEFTHEGDACTFEVLARRFCPGDGALAPIAEIVHDIDLKDGKFGRGEAEGIRLLLASICSNTADDPERIARGGALLDGLYEHFSKQPVQE